MEKCPCGNIPTIKMISTINPSYSFGVCFLCRDDPDFSQGFTENQIKEKLK